MREALTRWRDFARANGWTDADHHDADGTGWITMTEKALAGPQEGEDTHISDGYCPEHGLVKTVDDAGFDKCPDCGRATSFDAEEAERFEHQDDDPMNVSSVVCPEAVRGSAAWQNDLRIKELEAIIAKEGIIELNGAVFQVDDDGKLIEDIATCGTCGKSWNDALITGRTPAPSGRCPYEHIHAEIKELARLKRQ